MINIFNRRELTITFSAERLARIKDALASAGIEYRLRTVSRDGPVPFASAVRERGAVSSRRLGTSCEYIVYTHRDDIERARYAIKDVLTDNFYGGR